MRDGSENSSSRRVTCFQRYRNYFNKALILFAKNLKESGALASHEIIVELKYIISRNLAVLSIFDFEEPIRGNMMYLPYYTNM